MSSVIYQRIPRWLLFVGPFLVLAGAIVLLLLFTPLGDLAAAEEAETQDMLWTMVSIGVIVGIIPVAIGMLWFPFMQTLRPYHLHVVLALSAGVLAFVGFEMTREVLSYVAAYPQPVEAGGLALLAFVLTFAGMIGVSKWNHARIKQSGHRGLNVAYMIALGLGLHSLGEGIAIGSALFSGEVSLAILLIIGFVLDNVTEGPTVVAAVSRDAQTPPLYHFMVLGLIAGGPVIIGGWIAVLLFDPLLAAALLSVGIAAIAQVIWEVIDLIRFDARSIIDLGIVSGFVGGFVFMFILDEILIGMIILN